MYIYFKSVHIQKTKRLNVIILIILGPCALAECTVRCDVTAAAGVTAAAWSLQAAALVPPGGGGWSLSPAPGHAFTLGQSQR